MTQVYRGPVRLPRSGVSPRRVARAGDVWRLFQEVAVDGSEAAGHSPEQCHAAGVGFVVSEMAVHHHTEVSYGEPLFGTTWVHAVRRQTLFSRALSISARGNILAEATQRWVHVALGPDGPRPTRANPALVDAFVGGEVPHTETVSAPPVLRPAPGSEVHVAFEVWHTWMDALGHANHPATIDWCDEALSRHLHHQGLDPTQVVPLAERVRFRRGVFAGDTLTLSLQRLGWGERGVVFAARVRRSGDEVVCTAQLERGTTRAAQQRLFDAFD